MTAPAHSVRLHREALVETIDPEIALSTSQSLQPRREGGIEFPQTRYLRWNLREICVPLQRLFCQQGPRHLCSIRSKLRAAYEYSRASR